jgi:hypothetical protein
MPDPASTTMSCPEADLIPRQVVLPPKRMVDGPGTGREPRHPQMLIFMSVSLHAVMRAPVMIISLTGTPPKVYLLKVNMFKPLSRSQAI